MKALICGMMLVACACMGMQDARLRSGDHQSGSRITVRLHHEAPSLSTSIYDGLIECVVCCLDQEESPLIGIPCTNRHTELICTACLDKLSFCPLCRNPFKEVDEEVSCFSCLWGK